ncbi:MAG TPA: nucleoside-diphosphate sugar epimerase/dehydratase [Rubrivivax sp.]|nr:nucleoside-diphosphate sugar epimerase/dehydratase [Rubrivivax sp.]
MTATASTTIWHRLDAWLARLRPHRVLLSLLLDAIVVVLAWNVTYLFRLGFERWLSARPDYDSAVLAGIVLLYLIALGALRLPRSLWRFAGFAEVRRLTIACLVVGTLAAAMVMGLGLRAVPRAVLALHPIVTLMGLVLARIVYRMLWEQVRVHTAGELKAARRAIVMGAGAAARMMLAGIHEQGWTVLGLLDDDPAKQGARIGDVRVLGPLSAVADPALRARATHVIVALPSAAAEQRRRALELATDTGLPVLTVPTIEELREGRSLERLRRIEPEDLLGRAPVQLDEAGIGEILCGATVLVTGAGGSIGSELCRQLVRYAPARLVLVELSEFNLYTIEQELSASHPGVELVRLIGDVRDLAQMRQIFIRWRPQLVLHAAAYKHVPLMEDHNAFAALRNNTLGTWNAAVAAAESGAARFVLISTDKAVNPTNVMGASKRAAEMALSALVPRFAGTRFMAVRFGNVLGSSGSVIPKFKAQIARGGPVTVTHPEIIRYFMTIPEAARLVLQAAASGESGQVLVLDMGQPVKIADLARDLIRMAGHTLQEIPIVFTGLRPGEKLYEELLADADATLPTAFERLRIARLTNESGSIDELLELARQPAPAPTDDAVRAALARVVPEFWR